jgi:probable F420-dependent oxidoreductase
LRGAHRRPHSEIGRRGSRYWDPLATFGYLSAITTRIRFRTNVLVLGYHHPLEICKRYGTLDMVSGGRLILGLGVGSLKEEFDLIGVPFGDRGVRADDAPRALRASLSSTEPSYHGAYYDYEGLIIDPSTTQERVPLWIGGRTRRSLRRAVELGDGWCPFSVAPEQAAQWLRHFELPAGFQVVLPPTARPDPLNEPGRTQDAIARSVELGATIVSCGLAMTSLEEYLEALQALAELSAKLAR